MRKNTAWLLGWVWLAVACDPSGAARPAGDQPPGHRVNHATPTAQRAELMRGCMRIALEQIEADPMINGVLSETWFPGDRDHRDEFVLQCDDMRDVIHSAWGGGEMKTSSTRQGGSKRRVFRGLAKPRDASRQPLHGWGNKKPQAGEEADSRGGEM